MGERLLLRDELAEAEARVVHLKRQIGSASCAEAGHVWRHIGGKNAGCPKDLDCGCSVPVHECEVCGDCDYGDNAEADRKRIECSADAGREALASTSGDEK